MFQEKLPPVIERFHEWFRTDSAAQSVQITSAGGLFIHYLKERERRADIEAFIDNEIKEKPNSNFIGWAREAIK